jgi:hypothetical protein
LIRAWILPVNLWVVLWGRFAGRILRVYWMPHPFPPGFGVLIVICRFVLRILQLEGIDICGFLAHSLIQGISESVW